MISGAKEYLQQHNSLGSSTMRDLSHTLSLHRTHFSSGWVSAGTVPCSAADQSMAIESLDTAPQFKPVRLPSSPPRIGMVFTGQGAQWHAMGRELIEVYPIFRVTLHEAGGYLKEFGADWLLVEELMRDAATTRVNQTDLSISICVAVQIALVRLLKSWGIEPTAVTSHSSGEIAAAYTVGALSLRQAMAAAYYRSSCAAFTPRVGPKGAMAAIGVGEEAAKAYLERLNSADGKAVVACINSPRSVTIAGDEGAVQRVLEMADASGVFARRLKVDTGYHSHHMQPIAEPYRQALRVALASPHEDGDNELNAIFSSPVTGGRITQAKQLADPEHWVGSLLQPVQFVRAFSDMIGIENSSTSGNVDLILEVGPHTALGGPIKEILALPEFEGLEIPYMGCLTRNQDARECMLAMALNLVRKGYQVDLSATRIPSHPKPTVLTDLPSYPWNHTNRYWTEARVNQAYRQRDQEPHHLLGSPDPGANPGAATWRQRLRVSESPWLRDHVVQGNILYPGAGYVCLAIEATKQLSSEPASGYKLRDIEINQALVVPDNADGIEIQTVVRSVSDKTIGTRGWKEFEILSVTPDSQWTQHAKGIITVDITTAENKAMPNILQDSGYTKRIDPEDMWSNLRRHGLSHGPLFQNTKSIVQEGMAKDNARRCVTTIQVADCDADPPVSKHVLHPTTLDSVVIAAYAALPGAGAQEEGARVPRSIQKLWVSAAAANTPGHVFTCNTKMGYLNAKTFQADIAVVDNSTPVIEMGGLICQSLGRSLDHEQQQPWTKNLYSKVEWAPDLLLSTGLPGGSQAAKAWLSPSREVKPWHKVALMDLRRLCVYFCHNALQALTEQDIGNLKPHHVKYYAWMKNTLELAASRRLSPDSDTWIRDSLLQREKTIASAESRSVDGELICHLGPMLVPMLRGEQSPLEVMMKEKLLSRYDANALRFAPGLAQFTSLLRAIVHKNPRARVLEIGAGAGGATRHALQALGTKDEGGPFVDSWHYTDISSGFFEAARDEFASQVDMRFDRLDIEQDPASQGFELENYDIVVACRVLHATKDMTRTMENVRKLMKPGASLLLVETTQDQVDAQFVYGLLPGWWLGEEPERKSSPSMPSAMWERVLKDAGFNGIDLELRDYDAHQDIYSISNILASVPAQPSEVPEGSIVIVTNSTAPPPDDWLEALRAAIANLVGGPLPVVQSLEASDMSYNAKSCVFIGEAGQPLLHDLQDAATLKGIKAMVTNSKSVLWVTRGGAADSTDPNMALAHGLLRVLRNEYVGRSLVMLDLDSRLPAWSKGFVAAIVHFMKAGMGSGQWPSQLADSSTAEENEFALRDGLVLVPRIQMDAARNKMLSPPSEDPESIENSPLFQEGRPLSLKVGMPGVLDSLVFDDYEGCEAWYPESDAVEIEPRAYGVNLSDVMVAMGQTRDSGSKSYS